VLHRASLERLFAALNEHSNLQPLDHIVSEGDIVAAPFEGNYLRAKICQVQDGQVLVRGILECRGFLKE